MTETNALRQTIADLHLRHKKGDLNAKAFQKQLVERELDLYRSEVLATLEPGEIIALEHHAISAHMRLNQSVLREPEQLATSWYLTDRRLVRLRSTVIADRPATCDERDRTVIEHVLLADLDELTVHREIRVGEFWTGIAIALIAFIFSSWLLFTSNVMIGLGLLGALHAVLLPSRWLEITTKSEQPEGPLRIDGLRRPSARRLRSALASHLAKNRESGP